MLYFMKGKLPWQGLRGGSLAERYEKIRNAKMNIGITELCQKMPEGFENVVKHVRELEFEEKPNYKYIDL